MKKPFKEIDLEQGSGRWHWFRSLGIGASEANILAGVNQWSNVTELWELKTGLRKRDKETNAAMQHGIDLEPKAREEFTKATGIDMTPVCMVSTKHDFIRASLDGANALRNVILEIKCPTRVNIHMGVVGGKIPHYYYPQVQHQLFVSGAEVCCFWSYTREIGGFLLEIEPDKPYIKELIKREKLFWKHVQDKTPPNEDIFTPMSSKG